MKYDEQYYQLEAICVDWKYRYLAEDLFSCASKYSTNRQEFQEIVSIFAKAVLENIFSEDLFPDLVGTMAGMHDFVPKIHKTKLTQQEVGANELIHILNRRVFTSEEKKHVAKEVYRAVMRYTDNIEEI